MHAKPIFPSFHNAGSKEKDYIVTATTGVTLLRYRLSYPYLQIMPTTNTAWGIAHEISSLYTTQRQYHLALFSGPPPHTHTHKDETKGKRQGVWCISSLKFWWWRMLYILVHTLVDRSHSPLSIRHNWHWKGERRPPMSTTKWSIFTTLQIFLPSYFSRAHEGTRLSTTYTCKVWGLKSLFY